MTNRDDITWKVRRLTDRETNADKIFPPVLFLESHLMLLAEHIDTTLGDASLSLDVAVMPHYDITDPTVYNTLIDAEKKGLLENLPDLVPHIDAVQLMTDIVLVENSVIQAFEGIKLIFMLQNIKASGKKEDIGACMDKVIHYLSNGKPAIIVADAKYIHMIKRALVEREIKFDIATMQDGSSFRTAVVFNFYDRYSVHKVPLEPHPLAEHIGEHWELKRIEHEVKLKLHESYQSS